MMSCDGIQPAGPHEEMMLAVDLNVSWVAQPDVIAKVLPSKRFKWAHMDIRPTAYIRLDYLQCEGKLRLCFPLMNALPIFNGMTIAFLEHPEVCCFLPQTSCLASAVWHLSDAQPVRFEVAVRPASCARFCARGGG
jgi:hypothetical protein